MRGMCRTLRWERGGPAESLNFIHLKWSHKKPWVVVGPENLLFQFVSLVILICSQLRDSPDKGTSEARLLPAVSLPGYLSPHGSPLSLE